MNKDEIVAGLNHLAKSISVHTDVLNTEREKLWNEKEKLEDMVCFGEAFQLSDGEATAESYGCDYIEVEILKHKEKLWPKYRFTVLVYIHDNGQFSKIELHKLAVISQSGNVRRLHTIPVHAKKWFEEGLKSEAQCYAGMLLQKYPEPTKKLCRLIAVEKRIEEIDAELKQYRIKIPGMWYKPTGETLQKFADAIESLQFDAEQLRTLSVS